MFASTVLLWADLVLHYGTAASSSYGVALLIYDLARRTRVQSLLPPTGLTLMMIARRESDGHKPELSIYPQPLVHMYNVIRVYV